ncbi:MAG: hypothetical protein K0Q72_2444 [Armatimonadetes bacterium]|nr:hypothetical protein [Armatimonadota bacterium]
MLSNTTGPSAVRQLSSVEIVSMRPSAYSIRRSIKTFGAWRQGASSKYHTATVCTLSQPVPSITPRAFFPGTSWSVTSCAT